MTLGNPRHFAGCPKRQPSAWQQHLGKALRRNNYDPRFYSTWSTNGELDAYYRRKNKERQEKMERDYIEKITARNAE